MAADKYKLSFEKELEEEDDGGGYTMTTADLLEELSSQGFQLERPRRRPTKKKYRFKKRDKGYKR